MLIHSDQGVEAESTGRRTTSRGHDRERHSIAARSHAKGCSPIQAAVGTSRRVISVSQRFTHLAGSNIPVGMCVRNGSTHALDANGWLQGHAMLLT